MTTVSATLECYADTGYLLINGAIAAEFRESAEMINAGQAANSPKA
jgi:hypothetical protein